MITDPDDKIINMLNEHLDENVLKNLGWEKHEKTFDIKYNRYTHELYPGVVLMEYAAVTNSAIRKDYAYCYCTYLRFNNRGDHLNMALYTVQHLINLIKYVEKINKMHEMIQNIEDKTLFDIEMDCKQSDLTYGYIEHKIPRYRYNEEDYDLRK